MHVFWTAFASETLALTITAGAQAAQNETTFSGPLVCTVSIEPVDGSAERKGDRVFVVPIGRVREKTPDGSKLSTIDGPVSITYATDGVHVMRSGRADRVFSSSAVVRTGTEHVACPPEATVPEFVTGTLPAYVVP